MKKFFAHSWDLDRYHKILFDPCRYDHINSAEYLLKIAIIQITYFAKILPIRVVAVDGEYFGVDTPHIKVGMPVVVGANERLQPDQPAQITG